MKENNGVISINDESMKWHILIKHQKANEKPNMAICQMKIIIWKPSNEMTIIDIWNINQSICNQ